jgi:hypothetical protein
MPDSVADQWYYAIERSQSMWAISVRQPWASLIATGAKTIETRTWQCPWRGDLLICATKPDSCALCIVEIYDCRPMEPQHWPAAKCDPYPKAYGWWFRNVRPVEPVHIRGMLRRFHVEDSLIRIAEPPLYGSDPHNETSLFAAPLKY